MKLHHIGFTLLLFSLLVACTNSSTTPSAGDIQTAIAQTQAANSTLTSSNTTSTPSTPLQPSVTPSPTNPPYTGPITGRVSAFSVNLRNGPSTLHTVIGSYPGGTELLVTSRVAENDWVEVDINGHIGWMFAELLVIEGNMNSLPIITFPDSLAIRGRVEDTDGNPIRGITVSVFYHSTQGELRVNVSSDQDGEFSAYLPKDLVGTLDVQVTGRECHSPVVDFECQLDNYIQLEDRVFVTIPQYEDIIFLYKPVTLKLKGKVYNSDGTLVAGITVAGIRDDGSKTFATTNALGEFSMPIDEGIWGVFTISLDPAGEGARVAVTVADSSPANIELFAPFGGITLATPIGAVPSNVVLGRFISGGLLRKINNYNAAGKPVMKIYEPRYKFQQDDQIWLYAEPVLADGGNYFYEVYDPNYIYPVTMYVRVIDIEIIPK